MKIAFVDCEGKDSPPGSIHFDMSNENMRKVKRVIRTRKGGIWGYSSYVMLVDCDTDKELFEASYVDNKEVYWKAIFESLRRLGYGEHGTDYLVIN